MRYKRRTGVSETAIDDELFLADSSSGELFHLDRTATGLWTLLAEPSAFETILGTFSRGLSGHPGRPRRTRPASGPRHADGARADRHRSLKAASATSSTRSVR
jgi:hypothetical protein